MRWSLEAAGHADRPAAPAMMVRRSGSGPELVWIHGLGEQSRSLDAIARIYHVHRATVVRWLAAVRDDLESAVSARLWQDLGISPSEIRSLWKAVRSDVDVSLSRLLVAG